MGGQVKDYINIDPSTHRMKIIRWIALLIPLLLVAYSVFMQFSPLGKPTAVNMYAFYAVNVCWVIIGFWQFFAAPRQPIGHIAGLVGYHILALTYVLTVSGFDMPLIYTWSALLLASSVYLGQSGINISIATLFAAASGSVIIHASDDKQVVSIVIHFLGTLIISYMVKMVISAQAIDQAELLRSQTAERLQRDRIVTIVNNLSDAIISTDRNGIISLYNASALNLFDTNTDLAGKCIDDFISIVDNNKEPFKFADKLHSAKTAQFRDDLTAKISNESIRLGATYSPIRSTNSVSDDGYVIILRDITKQKSLDDERDEFISVVSHELRTPITIAEGSLSNVSLMIKRPDIPKERLINGISTAHEQIIFLARMVNDLSTLSRAERGVADEPENIDVQALIDELYAEYAPQAADKSLTFDIDIAPQIGQVSQSRLYLKEILQNFITNAIRYTEKGGVTIIVKPGENDTINFAVKDTGIGISRSDQAHLYQKFWRSEDYRTRETSGTGLGLYVVDKLALKLKTEIKLKSRLNHGSTFSFSLPAVKKNKS